MNVSLHQGDCLVTLRGMADNSVDSIVTDPPYGLSFMGKKWDYDVPSVEIWAECLRVLKPGGHLLAFAGTRTQHRMAVRIEDAGFEIRDMIAWVYGSGFPKSLDVSKAIDKAAGAEREVTREGQTKAPEDAGKFDSAGSAARERRDEPATDAARQWQGWGTALKPALEPITMARKPFASTVAANVLEHGTGALNIDGCRVGTETVGWGGARGGSDDPTQSKGRNYRLGEGKARPVEGRWPANLILSDDPEVVAGFPDSNGSGTARVLKRGAKTENNGWGMNTTAADFAHLPDAGTGSAARFFKQVSPEADDFEAARFIYCAKASKADREEGLDHMAAVYRVNGNKWTDQDYRVARGERPPSAESGWRKNTHPTVKPTDLMAYLCRLVTPPGGVVLDPFMGSGSTGKAALREGFGFIGCEMSPEYMAIARARIEAALAELFV